MGGLFGGTVKAGKPQYTGIQIQTSASTLPVPLIWGMNRGGPNLIWYGDFKANKQKQKTGKGGGTKTEYYTYSASLMMSLCEGEIVGISKAYIDQSEQTETDFASTGYSLFTGSDPQSPWGYLASAHPGEALNYAGIAYVAIANYDLGQGAALPQHNFEIQALRYDSAEIGLDADSALVVDDFLTDEQFGVGFSADMIDYDQLFSTADAPTTGDSTFQTYCRAMGFAMSPILSSQEQASTILDRWCRLMNTAPVWTGEKLKLIPYGDEPQTGGGVTYIPNTEVRYALTDSDYVGGSEDSDPITMTRSDPAEAYNSFKIEINDRDNQYNGAPVEWRDQNLVELYGLRPEGSLRASEITRLDMASRIVALMGQRRAYIRNEFYTSVSSAFVRLEPMDIITVYDPSWGVLPVRVKEVTETDEGDLELLLEEFPEGVSSTSGFGTQPNQGGGQNQSAPPGPVNPPLIFEPPLSMTNGVPQIWAAVSGGDGTLYGEYWGGANVWLSLDNVTYQQVGVVESPARMGELTAALPAYGGVNPDNANTLKVDLLMSDGELITVSALDAENGVTLCYVDGEYLSYEEATLTGTNAYDLTTLYRGLNGSTPGAHSSGDPFARLDENIFKIDLQTHYIGQTVYIKLQSFNLWGNATEDLADVNPYTFVPTGGGIPAAPTTLDSYPGQRQVNLVWTDMDATSYRIYAYHGITTDFADATLLATSTVPTFTHYGLGNNDTWTYWVTTVTIGGESLPAGPDTETTN